MVLATIFRGVIPQFVNSTVTRTICFPLFDTFPANVPAG